MVRLRRLRKFPNPAGRPDNLDSSNKTHLRIPSVRAYRAAGGNRECESGVLFDDPKIRDSPPAPQYVYGQAFIGRDQKRKVLIVNKRDRPFEIIVPEGNGAEIEYVDQSTASDPPAKIQLMGDRFTLNGFGVAVVILPN